MKHGQLRANVLLSIQRALLGVISSKLRGVTVAWSSVSIDILCFFDGPISDDDKDAMQEVETEVMADFVDHEVSLNIERHDAPKPMSLLREWVYRRRE
jgi:hypothetical protein